MNFIKNKLIYIVLIILLLADLSYSCYQYSKSTIDGDFPAVVLGIAPFDKVLEDPLGFSALKGETYGAPNRFTAHAAMVVYFRYVPFALQSIVSPLDSIYISITAAKLIIHILLLLLISYYATAWKNFKWKYILAAAVLISPFLHVADIYSTHLMVIDTCITYVMFYALPMAAMLIFYLPLYYYFINGQISKSKIFLIGWILFALLIALFGPLTAPVLLVSILILFTHLILKNFYRNNDPEPLRRLWHSIKSIDKTILIIFAFTGIWSLYSIYIGTKNIENDASMPLEQRYSILIKAIYEVFFKKESGILYILTATTFNLILVYILYRKTYRQYFKLIFFLFIFCIIYIMLLPMGGYRWYRPMILRRDTIMPVLCILFYCWATTCIFLVTGLSKFKKLIPLAYIAVMCIFYTKMDLIPGGDSLADLEKQSILKIAAAKENCIELERTTPVARWSFNTKCEESDNSAALLEYYNITPRKIQFYYPEEKK